MSRWFMSAFAAIAAASALSGQPPAFEVATVKVNRGDPPFYQYPRMRNGRMTAGAATLKQLIETAWTINELRITGPNWLDTDKFDIQAKAPDGTPDGDLAALLKPLLVERFGIVSHKESKEMSVYRLMQARGGSKLKPFDAAHPPEITPATQGMAQIGLGTTAAIADAISRSAGRPVIDKTGIEGSFAWMLNYRPQGRADDSTALPDLFTAIQEQLGLKLEPGREAIEVLVIDRAERVPVGN